MLMSQLLAVECRSCFHRYWWCYCSPVCRCTKSGSARRNWERFSEVWSDLCYSCVRWLPWEILKVPCSESLFNRSYFQKVY